MKIIIIFQKDKIEITGVMQNTGIKSVQILNSLISRL